MNYFTISVGTITTLAALVTVYFAWKASRESSAATQAAQETASESRAATQAAQETAKVAAAAAREYERWRHQDHLRAIAHYVADIARLAGEIGATALARAEAGCTTWLSPEQEHLGISMEGMRIPLPQCRALAQPVGPALLGSSDDEAEGLVARRGSGSCRGSRAEARAVRTGHGPTGGYSDRPGRCRQQIAEQVRKQPDSPLACENFRALPCPLRLEECGSDQGAFRPAARGPAHIAG
jgi:hypothetical protein